MSRRVVSCNTGEVAVGGGGGITTNGGAKSALDLIDSKPLPNTEGGTPTGWSVWLNLTGSVTAAAYVICARP